MNKFILILSVLLFSGCTSILTKDSETPQFRISDDRPDKEKQGGRIEPYVPIDRIAEKDLYVMPIDTIKSTLSKKLEGRSFEKEITISHFETLNIYPRSANVFRITLPKDVAYVQVRINDSNQPLEDLVACRLVGSTDSSDFEITKFKTSH